MGKRKAGQRVLSKGWIHSPLKAGSCQRSRLEKVYMRTRTTKQPSGQGVGRPGGSIFRSALWSTAERWPRLNPNTRQHWPRPPRTQKNNQKDPESTCRKENSVIGRKEQKKTRPETTLNRPGLTTNEAHSAMRLKPEYTVPLLGGPLCLL